MWRVRGLFVAMYLVMYEGVDGYVIAEGYIQTAMAAGRVCVTSRAWCGGQRQHK